MHYIGGAAINKSYIGYSRHYQYGAIPDKKSLNKVTKKVVSEVKNAYL
jgi:hypothetical protein